MRPTTTGVTLGGGKFANGAATAAFLVSTVEAAEFFQNKVGGRATLRPGENRTENSRFEFNEEGQQFPEDRDMNVVGLNRQLGSDSGGKAFLLDSVTQSGPVSKVLNFIPGVNNLARVHDFFFNSGALGFNLATNLGTIPAAGAISFGAIIGQPLQGLSNQQLINLSVANSFDKDDDRRVVFGTAAVGGR